MDLSKVSMANLIARKGYGVKKKRVDLTDGNVVAIRDIPHLGGNAFRFLSQLAAECSGNHAGLDMRCKAK